MSQTEPTDAADAAVDQEAVRRIEAVVDRVRRRVNAQVGFERATTGGAVAVMFAMVALVLWKTGWMSFASLGLAGGLLAAIPLAGFASAWIGRRDPVALAQRIDRSHELHDRLSTALSLARQQSADEFSEAQLRDALHHLDEVEARRAAPFDRPNDLSFLLVFAAGFALLALFRPPSHAHPLPEPPEIQHDPVLDEATIAMEKERVREMTEKLEGTDDEEAEQLVRDLEELLEKVEKREISGKEFLDELEKLEKRHFDRQESEAEKSLADELKEAAEKLQKEAGEQLEESPEMKKTVEALKQKDLDEASRQLDKLAEKMLSDDKMDPEKLEKMAKMFEKLAENLDVDRKKLEKMLEKHEDLVKKLAEKFNRDGELSTGEKRRLNRAKKKRDELKEKLGDNTKSEKERQLERLQRKSKKSAEKMKKAAKQKSGDKSGDKKEGDQGDKPDYQREAGRQMKKTSREVRERAKQKRSEDVERMARKQIEELRESMRRSRPQRARSQSGQGSKSKDSSDRGEKMREFIRRAQGQSDSDSSQKSRQKGKKGQSKRAQGDSKGQKGGEKKGGEKGKQQSGGQKQSSNQKSNAAGDQPGGKALGEKTSMDSKRKKKKMTGRKGAGPSRSKVIRSASEKGFATREYKEVYGDYSSVVEEVMKREDVPPGYRYYVKRYFELIKPRD